MPLKFGSISAAQLQQQQKPAKQKSNSSPRIISSRKPAIIGLAAYGGKLFEPNIKRDKPIIVHFEDYFCEASPDLSSFVRFSTDGFFALRYFPDKDKPTDRCILYYFRKPVQVSRESTIAKACEEAMIFECHEFEGVLDEEGKLVSAIYEARDFIRGILQERIIAEMFLKRQQRVKEEENQWQAYFAERKLKEEEDEKEDAKYLREQELERESSLSNQLSGNELPQRDEKEETSETSEVQAKESEEKILDEDSEAKISSDSGNKTKNVLPTWFKGNRK